MSARDPARTVGAEMIYSEDFQSGALLGGVRVVNPFAT
jgi:predicted nucleic acid-binding protein